MKAESRGQKGCTGMKRQRPENGEQGARQRNGPTTAGAGWCCLCDRVQNYTRTTDRPQSYLPGYTEFLSTWLARVTLALAGVRGSPRPSFPLSFSCFCFRFIFSSPFFRAALFFLPFHSCTLSFGGRCLQINGDFSSCR